MRNAEVDLRQMFEVVKTLVHSEPQVTLVHIPKVSADPDNSVEAQPPQLCVSTSGRDVAVIFIDFGHDPELWLPWLLNGDHVALTPFEKRGLGTVRDANDGSFTVEAVLENGVYAISDIY